MKKKLKPSTVWKGLLCAVMLVVGAWLVARRQF